MRPSILLIVTLGILAAQDSSAIVGSKPTSIVVTAQGFDSLRLVDVVICRYSKELGRWVADIRAKRDPAYHAWGTVDLRVDIMLKNGTRKSFDLTESVPNLDYWKDEDGWYAPEDVASFKFTITRESWIDDEKRDAQEAAEHKRAVAGCRALYSRTANKKIADLTVKEEQAVRACQKSDLYPPE